MKFDDLLFWVDTGAVTYTTGQTVSRVENCKGFIAVNTGDEIAFVNDHILYPGVPGTSVGNSITMTGGERGLYLGQIRVKFQGGGADPQVQVNQMHYVMGNQQLPNNQ